jgi:hypothetical protein
MDQHMTAIVELRERVRAHDEDIARHDQHLAKLDETVSELRMAIATVATKDDILSLSRNIDEKFNRQLSDAHNSIPAKIGLWLTGGAVLVSVIALFLRHG